MAYDKNRKPEEMKNQKKDSLLKRLSRARNSRVLRAFSTSLAVMTVFGTTYGMILPAITVDHESAEEMPGIYLEEESFRDADYEDGVQDADYENVYEDGIQGADYENANEDDAQSVNYEDAYEDGIQGADYEDVYEESEWLSEEESSDEDYFDYDNADEDEYYVEIDENDSEVIADPDYDAPEYEDSSVELPAYTYLETRLETTAPVQTHLLGDVTIRLDYNSAAMIPDGSILAASEIAPYAETAEEAAYKEWRLENLTYWADPLIADLDSDWCWKDASFFDVELTDSEGIIRQPESQIYLTVYFTNPIYTEKVHFVRFITNEETDTEMPEIMDPVDLGCTEDGGIYAGVFLADSLAPFGVITGDSLQAISEQQAEQAAEDTEIWEDEPETEEENILVDETVEDDGFEVESEAELMEEVALTESETESVAEPVLTESETESVAEPVLTESETESVAEPVLTESETESAAEPVLTESGTESAAEPVLEEAVEYPPQVFRGGTENVNVTVHAPEGAFPADTIMTVQDVSSSVINDITEAVSDDSTTVNKVHAVDITFSDGKGNEIEPLVPVKMTITAEEKQKTEETLVVHVSDEGNVEQVEDVIISDGRGASRARLIMEAGESGSAVQTDSAAEAMPESVVDSVEGTEGHEVVANAFSVYAIVYTVDFHYEVNGKEYKFSIPGGGFVSLEHLVEVLGIAGSGEKTDDSGESEVVTEDIADTDITGTDAGSDTDTKTHEEAISINHIEVSEATKKFVADVTSVEFSSPKLVWVGKVDETTKVGTLKEANRLEVQYSAGLTEEQIAEINSSTVEAGDWALISMQPFTSEESLTVTMKNGDRFVVRVTDAQKPYKDVNYLESGNYIIYRSDNSNSRYMFLKNDGTTDIKRPANGEALNASDFPSYTWSVTENSDGTYTIKSTAGNRYINLYGNATERDKWSNSTNVGVYLSGKDGIAISRDGKVLKRDDTGFYNSTGTGVGLTFYKIEEDPSGSTSHDTGIELTDEERAELSKWEETIAKFNTLTDYNKTAEVADYDKRIYKIDLEADSGVMDFYKDVDLGFVLDVSNSMKFPSSLRALEDNEGKEFKLWMDETSLNAAYWAYQEYYNRQGCFYILSDPALTSTIYRVFWNGSKWQYQDASSNDPSKIYDVNGGTTFKEPFRQSYTLYYADDQTPRIDYLNDSVAQAVATLKKIVQPTEGTDDETANVRIAYNFFAGTKTEKDNSGNTVITQYAIRGSHDFVDLRSQESRSFEVVPKGNEADGTRQDLALFDTNYDPNLAANEFGWNTNSNVDRYVILVTDGAPNGASMADVEIAAGNLKTQDNVKIITIGLSTKDVDGGSTLLKTIADDIDEDGTKDFYEAEKASDLKHILLKILQSLMTEGIVRGTITDTIDSAFYPVDSSGNPLSSGVYSAGGMKLGDDIGAYVTFINKTIQTENGPSTYLVREPRITEPFYTWEKIDENWKITWYNQEIGWNDGDNTTGNPWNGSIYVKAKEDYLGGNLIDTNDGADIEPTGIKLVINGNPESNWRPLEGMPHIGLPIPRVNVHNLETKENNTTFTIYKGTSVTPKEQLEALWNAIPIEEVVSSTVDGAHKITTGSGVNIGTGEAGDGETFTLGSLMSEVAPSFNIDELINHITASVNSASREFTYAAYGHESGQITVKVERTIGNQSPTTHTADTVGSQVEQYKVTFTYKPYTEAERKARLVAGNELDDAGVNDNNYHNGSAGRGKEETGTIRSENTHTINVFQKGIRVTKADKTNPGTVLPGAVFELYRVDAAGDANVSAYSLPSGSYSKVGGDLTADSNGIITINPVIPDQDSAVSGKTLYEPNIAVGATTGTSHETVFYLVEKTPPTKDGATYSRMPGAIKFTMTLTEAKGTDTTAALYDWTQSASIEAREYGNGTTVYLTEDAANTTTGTNSDIYAYTLKNGRPTDITLIKIDKTTQNSIGGAKFRMLKGSENLDLTKLLITAISSGAAVTPEDYNFNGTTIKVVSVPEGGIRIAGLEDATYTLQEVAAPAGYLITDSGKTFKTENGAIKNADDTTHGNEATDIAFKVENTPGAALPHTGGPGTTLIYLLGIMCTGIAGGGLAMKRRRKKVA